MLGVLPSLTRSVLGSLTLVFGGGSALMSLVLGSALVALAFTLLRLVVGVDAGGVVVVGVIVVVLGLLLPRHHTPRMYPTSRGGSWRQWEVWWWWVSSSCWACHCHVTTHPTFRRPIVPAPLIVLTIVRSTHDPPCEQLLARLGAGARSSLLSTLLGCPSVAVPFIVSFVSWGMLRRGRGVHT
jgi:hypothetical protein